MLRVVLFVVGLALVSQGAATKHALHGEVSIPKQCTGLEELHGSKQMDNFFLVSAASFPGTKPQKMCTRALDCKRLLNPLVKRMAEKFVPKNCPDNCNGNGICQPSGLCSCHSGFGGLACQIMRCPSNCSYPHGGTCRNGHCFCNPGYFGTYCNETHRCQSRDSRTQCTGHGFCSRGKCFCDPGFTGEDCSFYVPCPEDCNHHGMCQSGMCFCAPGWEGSSCSKAIDDARMDLLAHACPDNCNGKGTCVNGRCHCFGSRSGVNCSIEAACPKNIVTGLPCSAHGSCDDGKCRCDAGYWGDTCALVQPCPSGCNGHGTCHRGACSCVTGWEGAACEKHRPCATGCSGRGVCDDNGRCACIPGYYGSRCEMGDGPATGPLKKCHKKTFAHPNAKFPTCSLDAVSIPELRRSKFKCTSDCNGRGVCLHGHCACLPGFAGDDCGQVMMPNSCPGHCSNGRGTCVGGRCICLAQYTGPTCAEAKDPADRPNPRQCSANCSAHGECVRGKCLCDPGWQGTACTLPKTCANGCNGFGQCKYGLCYCNPGHEGASCEKISRCPQGCSGHGQCYLGKCFCDPYYGGHDCSVPTHCPGCTNGQCVNHMCVCDPGFTGVNCTVKLVCPRNCGGPTRGHCAETKRGVLCVCKEGFTGHDCSQGLSCPQDCSGKGTCVLGRCFCQSGYTGKSCNAKLSGSAPFQDLGVFSKPPKLDKRKYVGGVPNADVCVGCTKEKIAEMRGLKTHSKKKSSDKTKTNNTAGSNARFAEVKADSLQPDVSDMVDKVPQAASSAAVTCPDNCNNAGMCVEGTCYCNPGRTGDTCGTEKACPSNCNNHGKCKYGLCFCHPGYKGVECKEEVTGPLAQLRVDAPTLDASTESGSSLVAKSIIMAVLAFVIGIWVGKKSFKRTGLNFALSPSEQQIHQMAN